MPLLRGEVSLSLAESHFFEFYSLSDDVRDPFIRGG